MSLVRVSEYTVSMMMEVLGVFIHAISEKFSSLDQLLQYQSNEDLVTYFPRILSFMASETKTSFYITPRE